MNVSLARTSALAALLVAATAAFAQSDSTPADPLALDSNGKSLVQSATPLVTPLATLAVPEPSLELVHVAVPETDVLGVHYRPRSSGGWGSRRVDSQAVSQIHMGSYDPEGPPSREFLMGIRGGPMLDPHVQLGLGLDWAHINTRVTSPSHQSIGPNGYNPTVWQDISRASTHLVTVMPFLQVSADDDMPVVPYGGIAGGYEWLHLSADDYVNQTTWDADYGGWGWQIWAGAAVPLSGQVRFSGEVYLNTAEPARDVNDDLNRITYRESVKASGSGLRIGLAWGF